MKLSRRAHMRVSQVTGASPQGVLVHDHGELCVSVQLHGGGAVYSAGPGVGRCGTQ
jgi:hypothetical protein